MGGGQKGKKPGDAPVQKGGISKKKADAAKAADAPSKRKPKAKAKGDRAEDDDALIASLISCAAGSGKLTKKEEQQDNVDMELVAALAAEACLPARHGGVDGSEAEEPLPASYLGDEENHLGLQEEDLRGSGDGADDDGVMIAHLIDGAAEKNMDMELVAALAADAMTPSSGAGDKRSFANDEAHNTSDGALGADVDDFMNGSSESFAIEAQQDGECRGEREASNADTEPGSELGDLGDDIQGEDAKANGAPAGRACQHDSIGLRREASAGAAAARTASGASAASPSNNGPHTPSPSQHQPTGVCT